MNSKLFGALFLASSMLASTCVQAERPANHPPRNTQPADREHVLAGVPRGTGLAPTTWGFASQYSGSLYGSGYYAFRVDATFSGQNSVYGYTFSYPSIGFTNDIRAVYLFDVSGLAGQPGPIWSAFMFNVRERPANGSVGLFALGAVDLAQTGSSFFLNGLTLTQGGYAQNIDVFDAEDMENAAPFDNPQLAFSGPNNSLITSFAMTDNVVVPFSLNVTAAVNLDAAPPAPSVPVPTIGAWGTGAFGLLMLVSGLLVVRRRV